MRVTKRVFNPDGSGVVSVIAEECEDLWSLYNLILKGDRLSAVTFRKVQREGQSGSVFSAVHRTHVVIAVTGTDFDKDGGTLRVSGTVAEPNEWVQLGRYHTITIKPGMKLDLHKTEWDFIAKEKLREASHVSHNAEVAVLLMDMGIANFFLLTDSLIRSLCTVEHKIPKCRSALSGHDKARDAFFEKTLAVLLQRIDFSTIRCVIVAGPGFTREDFFKWLLETATSRRLSDVLAHEKCFLVCKASSPYKQALNEVITDPTVQQKMLTIKASRHVMALQKFYETLHKKPDCACYGPAHVEYAAKQNAIEVLMVTDQLFRASNLDTRRRYSRLVEQIKKCGADILVFSDMHISGEQLFRLGGIAAILRYSLPELDTLETGELGAADAATH